MTRDVVDNTPLTFPDGNPYPERATSYESVLVDVVTEIAEREGTDPLALPPLYDTIDFDRFEDLFTGHRGNPPERVQFQYCGHIVEVATDGSVAIDADVVDT